MVLWDSLDPSFYVTPNSFYPCSHIFYELLCVAQTDRSAGMALVLGSI